MEQLERVERYDLTGFATRLARKMSAVGKESPVSVTPMGEMTDQASLSSREDGGSRGSGAHKGRVAPHGEIVIAWVETPRHSKLVGNRWYRRQSKEMLVSGKPAISPCELGCGRVMPSKGKKMKGIGGCLIAIGFVLGFIGILAFASAGPSGGGGGFTTILFALFLGFAGLVIFIVGRARE